MERHSIQSVVMGVILIMVAFIMFAVVLDSVDTLLSWVGAGGTTLADFTGLEAIITIAPLLIFIGLLAGGGWLTFQGLRGGGGGKAGRGLH